MNDKHTFNVISYIRKLLSIMNKIFMKLEEIFWAMDH